MHPTQVGVSLHYGPYIDGRFIGGDQAHGQTLPIENPATGQVLGEVLAATSGDVADAVGAAERAASGSWRYISAAERAFILRQIASIVDAHSEELAYMDCVEVGKPLGQAGSVDVRGAAESFRALADVLPHHGGASYVRHRRDSPVDSVHYVAREPIGVVALITPFNVPLLHAARKMSAALAAGNTVVLKVPEQAMWATLRMTELIGEAGLLPDGVLNVLPGDGAIGRHLVQHRAIGAISFTGSDVTGVDIMASAAQNLPKLSFELGGKSPFIVFDDVKSVEGAAAAAVASAFHLSGQGCLNGTRFLVHEAIAAEFTEAVISVCAGLRLGDPMHEGVQMGPVISAKQMDRVLGYVKWSEEEGAKVLCGGARVEELKPGYFIQPTVIGDATPSMKVFREEIFGPVATLSTFSSDPECVEMANDTDFGLSAYVWTSDVRRAHEIPAQLSTGTVWVNSTARRDIDLPFGGTKRSGIGRQSPTHLLDFFSEEKAVSIQF